MMKWVLGTILGVVIGLGGYLSWHLGAFKSMTFLELKLPTTTVVSKKHTGAYHKIVSVIEDVEKFAKSQGLNCRLSFGEYFDSPDVVEEARLKSRGGCIIMAEEEPLLKKITWPEGIEVSTVPSREYVIALFSGSPGIGPMKVYPKTMQYIHDKKWSVDGPIIEVYEILSPSQPDAAAAASGSDRISREMTTSYLFPIKKN